MSSLNKNQHSSFNFCNLYKIAHNLYPIYRSLCFAGQAVGIKKYTVEDRSSTVRSLFDDLL